MICLNHCRPVKEDIQDVLTVCYWDILDTGVIGLINRCYKFDKSGECTFYYYNFYNHKRTDSVYQFDEGDVMAPDKWELKNDSIISIRTIDYTIIKYNSDTVWLKNVLNKAPKILVKNCKTLKEQ